MTGVAATNPAMDWAFVDRLRKFWKGKFLIKGIDTREDARLAVDHGLDGILVSNHGGRATETLRATVEALAGSRRRSERTAFRSSSMAASAAVPTCSRRWRWAPQPSESAGPPLGPGSIRPGRRRPRARNPARRTKAGHGQLRHPNRCRHQPRLCSHSGLENLKTSSASFAAPTSGASFRAKFGVFPVRSTM